MIYFLQKHPTTGELQPGFYVLSGNTKNNMGGPYFSMAHARKRMRQVEATKSMRR
jgi:hypothetical protein